MAMTPRVVVERGSATRRRLRTPQHRWYLRFKPWQVQPCFLAPVLPGETLDGFSMQARVVTKPVKNALIGWWSEWYLFYVKLSDMADWETEYEPMLLDPSTTVPDDTAQAATYHAGEGPRWLGFARNAILEAFFRGEGEAAGDFAIDGVSSAAIGITDWTDSMALQSQIDAADVDVDLDADSTITASEIDRAMEQWRILRQQGLTEMDYEDYLQTYGIRPTPTEVRVPELVRYIRDWSYPANTVDPSDGSVASALSWAHAERGDKNFFFREPGFLIGCHVVRPKVYKRNLRGSAAGFMTEVFKWLPAVLQQEWAHSYVFHGAPAASEVVREHDGTNATSGVTDGFVVDIRDLFMYGDQALNFDHSATADVNLVNLPYQATGNLLNKDYANDADSAALFASTEQIDCDGVINLRIASSVRDTSRPTTSADQ